jgi:hypothetical protein
MPFRHLRQLARSVLRSSPGVRALAALDRAPACFTWKGWTWRERDDGTDDESVAGVLLLDPHRWPASESDELATTELSSKVTVVFYN